MPTIKLRRMFASLFLAAASASTAVASDSRASQEKFYSKCLQLVEAAYRVSDFKVVSEEHWENKISDGYFVLSMWSKRGVWESFKISEKLGVQVKNDNDPTEEFGRERGIIYVRNVPNRERIFVILVHESIHALLNLAIAIIGNEAGEITPKKRAAELQKRINEGPLTKPEIRLLAMASDILERLETIARRILLSGAGVETHFLQEFVTHPLGTLSQYAHGSDVSEALLDTDRFILRAYCRKGAALEEIRQWYYWNTFPHKKTDEYMKEIMRLAPKIVEWISNDFRADLKPQTNNENVETFLSLTSSLFSFAELILSQKDFRLEGTGVLYKHDTVRNKIESLKRVLEEMDRGNPELELDKVLSGMEDPSNSNLFLSAYIRKRVMRLQGSYKNYNKETGQLIHPIRFVTELFQAD